MNRVKIEVDSIDILNAKTAAFKSTFANPGYPKFESIYFSAGSKSAPNKLASPIFK